MGEPSRLAVSVDVEDWYHVPAVTGSSFSTYRTVEEFFDAWEGEYDYLTRPTVRTLSLLDELDVTATFFVVADVVDTHPGLVEEIAARGHEIGCHGLHHECAIDPDTKAPRFDPTTYRERLLEAKSKLERASGRDVTGFRAPGAYVGGWVLDVLDDLGFAYDSSVARNSLYNKTDGTLEGVGTTPYVPGPGSLSPDGEHRVPERAESTPKRRLLAPSQGERTTATGAGRAASGPDRQPRTERLLELPWPYYEISRPYGGSPVARIPTAGGPLLRFFGRRVVQAGVEQSLRRGDSVFYFHPLDIARRSFPAVGNARRRPGYWLFTGAITERRVRGLLRSIGSDRCTTCGEVAAAARPEVSAIDG